MGLFDTYIPDPPMCCPVCGNLLDNWQGYDGPCGLMVWRQGVAAPVEQRADDVNLDSEDLAKRRLPERFTIYNECCSRTFGIEAHCRTADGVWTHTELETAGNAFQKSHERRAHFKARLRWLSGKERRADRSKTGRVPLN